MDVRCGNDLGGAAVSHGVEEEQRKKKSAACRRRRRPFITGRTRTPPSPHAYRECGGGRGRRRKVQVKRRRRRKGGTGAEGGTPPLPLLLHSTTTERRDGRDPGGYPWVLLPLPPHPFRRAGSLCSLLLRDSCTKKKGRGWKQQKKKSRVAAFSGPHPAGAAGDAARTNDRLAAGSAVRKEQEEEEKEVQKGSGSAGATTARVKECVCENDTNQGVRVRQRPAP